MGRAERSGSAANVADGEGFDFDEFHIEMMPAAARIMTLDGRYYISDFLKQHDEQ